MQTQLGQCFIEKIKLDATCWSSVASDNSIHFIMVQFILEISCDFAL